MGYAAGVAWATSDRRAELPLNWKQLVAATRDAAGGRCEWRFPNGGRCPVPGTDCDHISDPWDHSPENLQWLCARHHQIKTAQESAAVRRTMHAKGRHPVERAPGLR